MGSLKVIQPGDPAEQHDAEQKEQAEERRSVDLAELRRRLEESRGPRYWRSLEELAGDEDFHELLAREFPRHDFPSSGDLDRRRFLQLSAASLAAAGLAGCTTQPPEKIVPYIRQPEEVVPGKPLFFATSMPLAGYARPLLVESHMGRPTKVEGNPDHPASQGASDLFAQASILDLYDPDRAEAITHFGQLRSWSDFVGTVEGFMADVEAAQGRGLRILTGAVSSPTLAAQLEGLTSRLPEARWHWWEATEGNQRAGARMAFGEPVETIYDLSRADVVLSLDADFLTQGPGALRHAREFAARRDPEAEDGMNRLYAVETTPTNTGATADHRLALQPAQLGRFAVALAAELGVAGDAGGGLRDAAALAWVQAVAEDLQAHAGRGLVVVGPEAPAEVHALAHAINQSLGNAGATVRYTEPVLATPDPQEDAAQSLAALVADIEAGEVDTLLILGGNPVFDAPADVGLGAALDQVERRIYVGPAENETSGLCQWLIPEPHFLETWGDARSHDGRVCLCQPLIRPLYDSHSFHQVLALLEGRTDADTHALVEEYWTSLGVSPAAFRRGVHDGYLEGQRSAPRQVTAGDVGSAVEALTGTTARDGLTVVLRPDPTVFDGRFANNGWLQECPKPLTRLTWDNALLLAPREAEAQGLENEDVVRLSTPDGAGLEAPVWILPGQPAGTATLHFGYGRRVTGKVGAVSGVDAYPLRTRQHLWSLDGVTLEATGRRTALANTQDHFAMEGRHQVRQGDLDRYRAEPDFAQHMGHPPKEDQTFYPPYEYDGYAWGMAVDLNACTGCNACVVACQSENNIPVVGKSNVLNGREMHWIRIDRYFEGSLEDPVVHQQPVMCQHCELAPCEVVCPVAATVHSDEGLNDMVYNRCVGTRYCSNNCPYKVRRFNFLEYVDHKTPVLQMMRNPDVTVRERGIMEKCTYCVQRINGARQRAKVEDRKVRDGEIQTACQQACPSGAIVFGDINDPDSQVSQRKARPTNYGLLAELNTRPRTSYLAKVKNPNPALRV